MTPVRPFPMVPRRKATAIAASVVACLATAQSAQAHDEPAIRERRTPIAYRFELEPHLLAGTEPPGLGAGSGFGMGGRASFVILPDGFLKNVNDSVAIGAGVDVGRYYGSLAFGGYRDQCLHYENGPAGTQVCTEVTSNGGRYTYVYLPVVMQWNFWLTSRWSVFGEPGLAVYFVGDRDAGVIPSGYLGGRFRIAEGVTLTGRIGYPSLSLGVSFML
jgi:hypothetical protein